jgi:hypothetical protein
MKAIQCVEHENRNDSSPLVAVHEGMVPNERMEQRARLLMDRPVRVLTER